MNKPSESRKRILVIDDDADSLEMLRAMLQLSGYEVETAASVAGGLKLAKAAKFDLYILDNWFPDGRGDELCQQLRASDPCVPIMFYSGAAYESDIERGLAVGADAYLVKASDVANIEAAIARLIETSNNLQNNSEEETEPSRVNVELNQQIANKL